MQWKYYSELIEWQATIPCIIYQPGKAVGLSSRRASSNEISWQECDRKRHLQIICKMEVLQEQ